MNKLFKLKLVYKQLAGAILLLANGATFAVDPVPGIYAGAMLGVSYSPNIDFHLVNPYTGLLTTGGISQNILGDVGGQVGYRFKHFRVEGELFVNSNPYNSISFDDISVHKAGNFNEGLGQKGQTTAVAFMVNAFYDFYSTNELSYFAPYLGLGIGYSVIQNKVTFSYDQLATTDYTIAKTARLPAAQLIIGAGRFLDDFTFVGLDYRYLTTNTLDQPFTSRYKINSVNLTIGGSFDRG